MQKRLIIALAVSLGASLLVVAFLAGRLTAPTSAVVAPQPAPADLSVAEQASAEVRETPPPVHSEPLVREPLPSPRDPFLSTAQSIQPASPLQASAVTSYFAKIDAIHSVGSGDPMTFAQGIVAGLQAGDTSGLDSLVSNAKLALAQATTVQPPPACAEYHRRLLESLSESIAGMDKIRSALKKGDVGDLAALAAQFQSSQQKVEDLDRMKKQLLGN